MPRKTTARMSLLYQATTPLKPRHAIRPLRPRIGETSGARLISTVRRATPSRRQTQTRPGRMCATRARVNYPGSDLLSHAVAHAVPSAQEGLTSVFGMGTGVAPPASPPGIESARYLAAAEHGDSRVQP